MNWNKKPMSEPADQESQAHEIKSEQSQVTAMDRWLLRRFQSLLDGQPLAFALWNGEEVQGMAQAPIARMIIRDRGALYKLLSYPDLQFGDLYTAGRIEVEGDLAEFLERIYRNQSTNPAWSFTWRYLAPLVYRPRANSMFGSQKNIHHHYDLGNHFYRLWLDREAMQYTCAYFREPENTLETAQLDKMEYVCRKLRLTPGETVVEAGSGWGGFALYMARHYDVCVKAYNISKEQIEYSRQQAEAEGLTGQVEFIEADYRDISGQYDVFVSIGMLEHVGRANYKSFGEVIDRCLKPEGRGLLHFIGRNKAEWMNPWIEKRIFPGSYPPCLREVMDIFEPKEFSILDVENLRRHYAKTLKHWLKRFVSHVDEVESMFDPAFVRAWRLYLSGSIASFKAGTLQLFQVLFSRPTNNDLPWTRDNFYAPVDWPQEMA